MQLLAPWHTIVIPYGTSGIPSSSLMVPVAYHRHPLWYLWPTIVIPYGTCGLPSSSLMVPVAYHRHPLWYLWPTIVIPYGNCGLGTNYGCHSRRQGEIHHKLHVTLQSNIVVIQWNVDATTLVVRRSKKEHKLVESVFIRTRTCTEMRQALTAHVRTYTALVIMQ